MGCWTHAISLKSNRVLPSSHRFVRSPRKRTCRSTSSSEISPGFRAVYVLHLWDRSLVRSFQTFRNLVVVLPRHHRFLFNPGIIKERSTSSNKTSPGLGSEFNFSSWVRQHGSSRTHIHAHVRKPRLIGASRTVSSVRPNPSFNSDPAGTGRLLKQFPRILRSVVNSCRRQGRLTSFVRPTP